MSNNLRSGSRIRQDFLDFFKSKQHTIVPSSSLMPDAPNLLFTNAGMNQFVPIFLGQVKCPYSPPRAADTQKCIRAGGKHNDLEDVGLDTYHHTFFEMLGNWSFGDYFKKEAIDWAWELITEVWKFPKERLYATVFCPHMDMAQWKVELENAVKMAQIRIGGGTAEFGQEVIGGAKGGQGIGYTDDEAASFWAEHFLKASLDPMVHIVPGNRKDNFWMMGETGPCGPCSELHVDLTSAGDTQGTLVNKGDARCIEIWNLVFIQYNANADGTFSPLPAKHVDTGMGFERVTSIIQCTANFTDFTGTISNYETDIFRPIFGVLEKLSGKKYTSSLPLPIEGQPESEDEEQILEDIAFRVIADHIRTLSFAIADGIQPGNTDRNYVLRRILRRAVRYGRTLGFHEPFFYKLVDVLAETMGDVFPEIRSKKQHVQEVIRAEEAAFNKTLDVGIRRFNDFVEARIAIPDAQESQTEIGSRYTVPGAVAFELYDTYGFPFDLTELMAREKGFEVDKQGFEKLMEEQKARARAAQKKSFVFVSDISPYLKTEFVGYDTLECEANVISLKEKDSKQILITDKSPFYAAMGGQVGDTGSIETGGRILNVSDTTKSNSVVLLNVEIFFPTEAGLLQQKEIGVEFKEPFPIKLRVDGPRRSAIQRHHTVTHLLHWALHEVVSHDATQKGSFVGPDKLTFDFNSPALAPQQIADIEKLVNERILENAGVSWTEVPHADVKNRKDVMQFFGDKYGDIVRVVQIGGEAKKLNGYSMELCGGTHTRATGEIGLFRIIGESAIAAGVRRIEAVAGLEAYRRANDELQLIKSLAGKVSTPVHELDKKIDSLLAHQKELEKALKATQQREASNAASELLARVQTLNGIPAIIHNVGGVDGDFLQAVADSLKGRFKGVIVLGGATGGAVALVAAVSPDFIAKVQAGKIIQAIAPIVGGKGGGKPDNARGGGKDASKLDEALSKAKSLLG